MALSKSIYKDQNETYQADTCQPLVNAYNAGSVSMHALARGHYPGKRMAAKSLPGLCTAGFWDAKGKQDWGLGWHRNEGIEITFLETGNMPFSVDNLRFNLVPGDMTVTRPWQIHKVGNPQIGPGKLHWIILDVGVRRPNQNWQWPKWLILTKPDLLSLTNLLRHNEQPVWKANDEIRHCFTRIAKSVKNNEENSDISKLTVYLNELFILLLDILRQNKIELDHTLSSSTRTVQLFLKDLQSNTDQLAHQWSIEEMASHCGLGVTSFVHHCRQITNMTPVRYLNHCRIEKACQILLESPKTTITDVAFSCGFNSSQYFATIFKQIKGISPRSARQ